MNGIFSSWVLVAAAIATAEISSLHSSPLFTTGFPFEDSGAKILHKYPVSDNFQVLVTVPDTGAYVLFEPPSCLTLLAKWIGLTPYVFPALTKYDAYVSVSKYVPSKTSLTVAFVWYELL